MDADGGVADVGLIGQYERLRWRRLLTNGDGEKRSIRGVEVLEIGSSGGRGYLRYSLAISTARSDSLRSDPVTMNFLTPYAWARSSTSARSSSCAFLPW